MTEKPTALHILLEEQPIVAPSVPAEVVERVFRIEERVQFDGNRTDAASKIRDVIRAMLDNEFLEGALDGNAIE